MSKYNMVCENCMHGNICPHVEDITEARKSLANTAAFRNENSPVSVAVQCDGFKTNVQVSRLN